MATTNDGRQGWDPVAVFAAFLVASWLAPLLPSGTVLLQSGTVMAPAIVHALVDAVWRQFFR